MAREAPDAQRPRTDAPPQAEVIYRWVDAEGVTQVGRDPPPGSGAERIDIPDQRNIVPATPGADAPDNPG
nr:DUF4124 domain-containing protein [Coralloluteibacterium stylophorae]